jgi:hypothetical protein
LPKTPKKCRKYGIFGNDFEKSQKTRAAHSQAKSILTERFIKTTIRPMKLALVAFTDDLI